MYNIIECVLTDKSLNNDRKRLNIFVAFTYHYVGDVPRKGFPKFTF